jgi:hypothetical protein
MTIGDVGAAPKDPKAVLTTDYRAPGSQFECDNVRIIKVHGWWCTTSVSRIAQDGEIVLGGAEPRARIHSAGFRTRCSERPARMRQRYEIQRDSWSGWRGYSKPGHTAWTRRQHQDHGLVSAPCPDGRVGTYNYRLAVTVEVAGIEADDSTAAGAVIRADCGTGVSLDRTRTLESRNDHCPRLAITRCRAGRAWPGGSTSARSRLLPACARANCAAPGFRPVRSRRSRAPTREPAGHR